MRRLILGGARSGKSALAEQWASQLGGQVLYIATAAQGDEEMGERIGHHQARRPASWGLLEEPLALAAALGAHAAPDRVLLVDCLTLWLSNLLCLEDEARFVAERDALLNVVPRLHGEVIFVSNEVGMGIVPMSALARRFVDESGRLHQQLAIHCESVVFVAAGLPLYLKGTP